MKRTDIDVRAIFANHKSPFVLRQDLERLTGGLLLRKTMSNLDSLGQGIPGKFTVDKRKAAYPEEAVIEYLESKIS